MAANSQVIRIGKLAKFGKLTLTRKEDDLVIIYDSKLRKASLAKRRDLKGDSPKLFFGTKPED